MNLEIRDDCSTHSPLKVRYYFDLYALNIAWLSKVPFTPHFFPASLPRATMLLCGRRNMFCCNTINVKKLGPTFSSGRNSLQIFGVKRFKLG